MLVLRDHRSSIASCIYYRYY